MCLCGYRYLGKFALVHARWYPHINYLVYFDMSKFSEMPPLQPRHTPNPVVTTLEGEVKYLSRSIAVMAILLRVHPETGERWVAVQERGPKVSDSGKRCLVCGYLDYDESIFDAILREVFEETGLNLEYLSEQGLAKLSDSPFFINDDPQKDPRQNITFQYLVTISSTEEPPLTLEYMEPGEVNFHEWMRLTEGEIISRQWAFNHGQILLDQFFPVV